MEKVTLYKHQQAIVDKAPKKWLLAHEVGSGKTLTAIKLVEKNSKYGDQALVVCPKSVVDKWYKEIAKFKKKDIGWLVLSKENFKKNVNSILKKGFLNECSLVIDEVHNFEGFYSYNKMSQLLRSLLNFIKLAKPKNLYGLTGTPYMSSAWGIYALGLIFGHEWPYMKFKNFFFSMINFGGRFPVAVQKKGMEEHIAALINRLGNTVKLQDCFDVPEQTHITETFELTNSQIKAIKGLDDIVHIARWTKIHQICGGAKKGDNYIPDKQYKSEKLDRVIELAKQHKKLIIVCRYNAEIKMIADKLRGIKDVFIISGQFKNREETIEQAEQADNAIVIINAAVCEGYELPSFGIMIFYSLDLSLKSYIQIKGRILRADKLKKNVYIYLVVKDPEYKIDYGIYDLIINKKMDFHLKIFKNE